MIYNIFAKIIKDRLEEALDHELQTTQYGFRTGKSTSQAVHRIRRAQEFAERGWTQMYMVFLDWEKAFDKIWHEKLFEE